MSLLRLTSVIANGGRQGALQSQFKSFADMRFSRGLLSVTSPLNEGQSAQGNTQSLKSETTSPPGTASRTS